MTDPTDLQPLNWDDFSELHVKDDGGGVLSSLKTIRQGKLSELVRFVASLQEADRQRYVIEKSHGRTFNAVEIVMLSRRPDFPAA